MGLIAEPSLFVVDSGGTVVAYFEVGVSEEELRSALNSVMP
jgi:hypothetical protein